MKDHPLLPTCLIAALSMSCGGGTGTTGDATVDDVSADDTASGDGDAADTGADAPVDTPTDTPADSPVGDAVDAEDAPVTTCPGYEEPPFQPPGDGSDCRTSADCGGMLFCWLPGMIVCGYCAPPIRTCESDADCGDGICIETPPPCPGCPGGNWTQCIPRCSGDSCGDESTCDGTTGRCDPIPCTGGYECGPNTRCTGGGDAHGCAALSCTSDADCDCGACSAGTCIAGPGSCSGPVA